MATIAAYAANRGARKLAKYVGKAAAERVKQWNKNRTNKKSAAKSYGKRSFIHDHDGINMTDHVVVINPYKKKKKQNKVTQWVTYQQQNSENITGAAGAQGIGLVNVDLSGWQLTLPDSDLANGQSPTEYFLPLFNYKYDNNAVAQAAPSEFQTSFPNSGKVYGQDMFVKNIYYDWMIANSSNAPMVLDLYCVVSKKSFNQTDLLVGPWDPLTNGVMGQCVQLILKKRQGINKPAAAQPIVASGVYTPPTFGDYGLTTYGFNPFQLKGFRQAYKCKFHKKIALDGGAVHKFNIKCEINKWFNEERVRANAATIVGATMQWFVICRGAPAVIETAGAGATARFRQVTTAATQISWTLSKKITFGFAPGNTAEENWVAPGFPLVSGTTTTKIINSEDAEVNQYVVNEADTN